MMAAIGVVACWIPALRGLLPVPVVLVVLALLYSLIRIRVWPWMRRVRATRGARSAATTSTLGAV